MIIYYIQLVCDTPIANTYCEHLRQTPLSKRAPLAAVPSHCSKVFLAVFVKAIAEVFVKMFELYIYICIYIYNVIYIK